MMTFVPIEMSD